MTDSELRAWAETHLAAGSVVAREVIRLLDDLTRIRDITDGLATRVYAQSELLSRRAEEKS